MVSPGLYGAPFSSAVPSSKVTVTFSLYDAPSSTPVISGKVLSIVKLTVSALPAASVTISVYSSSSLIEVPETNASPVNVVVPSSKETVTSLLYDAPSSTPVISGKVLSIVKFTVSALPAASLTINIYSSSALISVPETYGSPFSVAVPSLKLTVTSPLYYPPSSTPVITGKVLSIMKFTVSALPAASVTINVYSFSSVIGSPGL